jgi:peptidoglycan/xylan/chitin deacetylase (PgdA/CDA1 family)
MDLAIFIGLLLLVYGLCDLLLRFLGVGALAQGNRSQAKIALTFDDGPSEHTGAILEVLRQAEVKASFFLTGQQAEKFPELVTAIRQEGHQIEAHGYWHKPAFFMAPWAEWEHIRRSPGSLYRPPHGIHSPFTRIFCRLLSKRVALWDLESKDWTGGESQTLVERMVFWCKPGSVLLLHDHFPLTLEILPRLLPRLKASGYEMVRLDAMELKPLSLRQGLQRANQGFHERWFKERKVQRLGLAAFDPLSVDLNPFPGPEQPGMPLGAPSYEVHLDSARSPSMGQVQLVREVRRGLALLAEQLSDQPEVCGVYGISHVAVALKVFGFTLAPVTGRQRLITGIANIWFLWLYRGEFPRKGLPLVQLAYITREELIKRYGKGKAGSVKA